MLIKTRKGLYCPAGDFYIDPSGAVKNAVITHAHSDHARRGSEHYFCAFSGAGVLRARIGKDIIVSAIPYGDSFYIGPVRLSFHPAGHILGSSQVRLEYLGEVWVVSGDYKREADPTCEAFEVVPCDVFISEATFGTPQYVWNRAQDMGRDIWEWWQKNAAQGKNSVLFAYSLGKTQRVLGLLAPYAKRPIYCHSASREINRCYEEQGIKLAPYYCLDGTESEEVTAELFIAPHSFLNSPQGRILGHKIETAFASGWMATQNFEYSKGAPDQGFVISDHADWNDLLLTIEQSKATRVFVQHRGHGALVKHLKAKGVLAFPDHDLIPEEINQMSFL